MTSLRIAPAVTGLALLGACADAPPAPESAAPAGDTLAALPTGGCWDRPLEADVNGAPHALTRTGPRTFTLSGPIFTSLEITLGTDGDAVFVQGARRLRRMEGDPAGCVVSGEANLGRGARALPIALAIAPAAG